MFSFITAVYHIPYVKLFVRTYATSDSTITEFVFKNLFHFFVNIIFVFAFLQFFEGFGLIFYFLEKRVGIGNYLLISLYLLKELVLKLKSHKLIFPH